MFDFLFMSLIDTDNQELSEFVKENKNTGTFNLWPLC